MTASPPNAPATLAGKRLLLIVGGGIAAYKALDLVRRLRERGAETRIVLTEGAAQFVTPLSLATLSGNKVHTDLFSLTDETEIGHIELSRWADLLVVAPASASLMARMASGQASDLASTVLLATDKRTLIAPAMNLRMWLHPATQRNLATLRGDGVLLAGPDDGPMACGEFGPGRMAEPLAIVAGVEAALRHDTRLPLPGAPSRTGALAGRHVLVTAGPTREPIDPVRYIANRSSGRQGYAVAEAAAAAGARVTLVSGPVEIAPPQGVEVIRVETARDMLAAVEAALPVDIGVFAAAVADWRVAEQHGDKLKKGTGTGAPALALVENPDILATIAHHPTRRPALVIGFAAETTDLLGAARAKLARKGCDLIVANDVGPGSGIEGGVMGGTRNRVHLVSDAGVETWPELDKAEVARRLVDQAAAMLAAAQPAAGREPVRV